MVLECTLTQNVLVMLLKKKKRNMNIITKKKSYNTQWVNIPERPHHEGQSLVNLTIPEENMSLNRSHFTNQKLTPSLGEEAAFFDRAFLTALCRRGETNIHKNPVSNSSMSLKKLKFIISIKI
jgi:hypothetical protein